MASLVVQSLHKVFLTENTVKSLGQSDTSRKRFTASFKSYVDQKMPRFWKMTLKNLSHGKLFFSLAILTFKVISK